MTTPDVLSIYLDANILIYLVEGYAEHEAALRVLIDTCENGSVKLITSELSIAEVLVQPMRLKRPEVITKYEQLLSADSAIQTAVIDANTLRRSAERRAIAGGSLLDAIHVATALLTSCSIFLSEDARIEIPDPLERMTLIDFATRFTS